jgi:hypothetical protein
MPGTSGWRCDSPQRGRLAQLANPPEGSDPHVLQHVEPVVRVAGQAGRVVEQRPLHHGH